MRNRDGSTLLESMIAFAIFAFAAVGIFPLIARVQSTSKGTDVRQLCLSTVKSKLAEYQAGRPIDWSLYTGSGSASDSADLRELTMATASAASAGGGMASGFMYAKLRYNQIVDGSSFVACEGTSQATLFGSGGAQTLGARECVGSNRSWKDVASSGGVDSGWSSNCSSNSVDEYVRREIPGFKLYVKLERFTPWQLSSQPSDATDRRFHPACPNSNSGVDFTTVQRSGSGTYSRPLYDFIAAGDQIRVTVTGVMDVLSVLPASTASFAGIPVADANRLTCQVSSLVAPPPQDYRYLLTPSDIRGPGPSVTDAMTAFNDGDSTTWPQNRQVLRSLASGTAVSAAAPDSGYSAYQGFAVHPLALSVYVLRGNAIVRYSDCGGVPFDCKVDESSVNGLEDNGSASVAAVQNLTLTTGGELQMDSLLGRFDPSAASAAEAVELFAWRRSGCEVWKITRGTDGNWSSGASPEDGASIFGEFGTSGCGGLAIGSATRALFMDPAGTSAFYLRDAQVGGAGSDADYFAVYSAHDSLGLYRYSLIKGGDVRAVAK